MEVNKKIKVLLYSDKRSDNAIVYARIINNIKKALKAVDIEVTDDINSDFDIAHFFSASDVSFMESVLVKKNKPVVIQTFSNFEDYEYDYEAHSLLIKKDAVRIYNLADVLLVGYNTHKLLLRHSNINAPIEIVSPATEYVVDRNNHFNKTAFRKYYGIEEKSPIIINYGVYDSDNGFVEYEALARIMPDIEFFFFGVKTSVLNSSERYSKTKNLKNLHFENSIPVELYDSMMASTKAFVITGRFHIEQVIIAEAMRAQIPIISAPNSSLYDLAINNKTAIICHKLDDFYEAIKNCDKSNYVTEAYEMMSKNTYLDKGKALKEVYASLINAKE